MLRSSISDIFARSNGGASAGGNPAALAHERTVAAAMATAAAARGINLNELLESIDRGGAQAAGSVTVLKQV